MGKLFVIASWMLISAVGFVRGDNPPLPGSANATNFAAAGFLSFSPIDPKACERVDVEYFNTEGVPTNTATLFLRTLAQFNNQSVTTNIFTLKSDGSGTFWTNSFYLISGVTQLVVSVVTDKGLIDDNGGANWLVRVVECDAQFARPTSPTTTTDQLTIYLRASVTPLLNATSITATATFDTGEEISLLMQIDTNNGVWSATIEDLPRFAQQATVLFAATGGEPINTNDPLIVALIVPAWPVKGDVDGDGLGDVIIQHKDTGFAALLGLESNRLISAGYIGGGFSFDPLRMVGASDLNIDGQEDIIWRYGDSDFYVWSLMSGTNILDADQLFDEETFRDWEIIAVADFNLDESGDLLVRHKQLKIWAVAYLDELELADIQLVDGSTDFVGWNPVASGDVDGDGFPDVVLELGDTRIYGILWMNDNVIIDFSIINGEDSTSLAPWKVVGLTDMDGDGPVEFILQLGDTGYHEIYHTDVTDGEIEFDGEALGGFTAGFGAWRVIGPK